MRLRLREWLGQLLGATTVLPSSSFQKHNNWGSLLGYGAATHSITHKSTSSHTVPHISKQCNKARQSHPEQHNTEPHTATLSHTKPHTST